MKPDPPEFCHLQAASASASAFATSTSASAICIFCICNYSPLFPSLAVSNYPPITLYIQTYTRTICPSFVVSYIVRHTSVQIVTRILSLVPIVLVSFCRILNALHSSFYFWTAPKSQYQYPSSIPPSPSPSPSPTKFLHFFISSFLASFVFPHSSFHPFFPSSLLPSPVSRSSSGEPSFHLLPTNHFPPDGNAHHP